MRVQRPARLRLFPVDLSVIVGVSALVDGRPAAEHGKAVHQRVFATRQITVQLRENLFVEPYAGGLDEKILAELDGDLASGKYSLEYLPLARSPSNSARIFSSSPTLEDLPFAQPWVGHFVTPDRASKLRALRSVTCASRMQLINMRTAAVFFLVICRLRRFGIGTRPYGRRACVSSRHDAI